MKRHKLLKLAAILALIGAAVFVINYFFFHFVTDEGITTVWHPEAGKPFVADLIGTLGVMFLFTSVLSLISAFVLCDKDDEGKENKEKRNNIDE